MVVVAVVDVVRDDDDPVAAGVDDADNSPRPPAVLALDTVLVTVDDKLLLLLAFADSYCTALPLPAGCVADCALSFIPNFVRLSVSLAVDDGPLPILVVVEGSVAFGCCCCCCIAPLALAACG